MIKTRQRILVVRYRFIGDTLLTVPFLRNLRQAYPEAIIDVLVGPNSGEVLRDCPYINELIFFDTTRKHRYENGDSKPQTFWSYIRRLRSRHYDCAFVLKRSLSSALLAFLSGIPERIGFDTEKRGLLLTQRIPYKVGQHEIENFLDVLRTVNIPVTNDFLETWWQDPEQSTAERLIPEIYRPSTCYAHSQTEMSLPPLSSIQNVVLHLSSSNRGKEWPLPYAVELTHWLLENTACILHFLGASTDAPLYENLRTAFPEESQGRLRNHCGSLSLNESLAFLHRVDCVVGVDSGTLHMAAAVGTPVIALFGPMDERKWAPIGAITVTTALPCRPCNLKIPCPIEFACMRDLQASTVIETIKIHARLT